MAPDLRTVTRDFARGEATLAALRAAARAEHAHPGLAEDILRLITAWEQGGATTSARSRNDLRERVGMLVPAAAGEASTASEPTRPKDPAAAMYEAGLRGQRRGN